jgi:hypothetical protein
MQTNTDITLYNKYLVGRVETWQRVQIEDVHWEQRHAREGNEDNDFTLVFIPFARGTSYLKPREWQASGKTGYWTLQIGDVIVKGLVSDELVAGTFTLSNLKAAYDDVLVIASVDTRDYGSSNLQHWEVTAR